MKTVWLFIRLSRPLFLLGAALLYAMGVGIARYLGSNINGWLYLLGQGWVTILQLSAQYLNEYYNAPADVDNPNRTPFTGGSGMLGAGGLPRRTALVAALTCLAILASLSVILIAERLPSAAYLIMGLAFLGAFFYSTPPLRLERTGYGELTASLLVTIGVPAFALILQFGTIHRLITMTGFPLFALHMAMLLAFELPDYANDLKYQKKTIMIRIGWERGMVFHNILILSAFLVLGIARVYGMPWIIVLPGFLILPFGLLQIWQMYQIGNGKKPNWTALTLNALVTFIGLAYLFAIAFWTH